MNQLNRKPHRSHEEVVEERKIEEAKQEKFDYKHPDARELLELVGGDTRMTWVKGEEGVKLRNILTLRALHVKKRLHQNAIEKGKAKMKYKGFYENHIAPMFKDNYDASSSEEEALKEEEERRKRKLARDKIREQKEKNAQAALERKREIAAAKAARKEEEAYNLDM